MERESNKIDNLGDAESGHLRPYSSNTENTHEDTEEMESTVRDQLNVREKRREERLKKLKERQFDQATLHQLFRVFDSTNSHVLSLNDFQTGLIAMGFKEAQDIEVVSKIMAEIDDDSSGNINESEFVEYFSRRRMEDLGKRLHEVASLGTTTTVQCIEYGVLDAEYFESKELHMSSDADIEQLEGLIKNASPETETWPSSCPRRWFIVNGYHTNTLLLFAQQYGIHEETMKDAGIFQRQKIDILTPGPAGSTDNVPPLSVSLNRRHSSKHQKYPPRHGASDIAMHNSPSSDSSDDGLDSPPVEELAHVSVIIHKLDSVPPLPECIWNSMGSLHHSPDPSIVLSQFAIYSISNDVLLTVNKDYIASSLSEQTCGDNKPSTSAHIWEELKERIRSADADVRVNSSSAKYLTFSAMEVIMEHNYTLRDNLKQWMHDLEAEIQDHCVGYHTLHLYEFGKFAAAYLSELRAMANCLEPIYDISQSAKAKDSHEMKNSDKKSKVSKSMNRNNDVKVNHKQTEVPSLSKFFDNEYIFFRDLTDEIETICSEVEEMISTAKGLSDYYRSVQDDRTNRTLYVLTLVTSIFVPAQFLTGLYGMNFENMPELRWHYSYYIFWVIVILTTALAAAWVRRSFTSGMMESRQRMDL